MKILMTADAVGGVWQYCLDLSQGLVRDGSQILLATMGPRPSQKQREQVAAIPRLQLVESDFALEWMQRPWRDVDAAGSWLLNLAAEFQPDIVHLNGYSHAVLPWQKPVLVTAHSCVFSWWRALHGCAAGPDWEEYKGRLAAGLTRASAVVAPSRYMAAAIEAEYGLTPGKVRVIHNFSRSPRFRSGSKQPFCLAAGRLWDPAKNLT
ncbi:MAG: glycosyltransferase, partial [Acidobacteriaceae bacterium]|nr:glycosyltransferase [Acidobacteriaceae bacterium]